MLAALLAPLPGRADESAAARLAATLAAKEAREGKSSPYLLPVIEELAQAHWRDGDLAAVDALRRRALGIAIGAFGCESASAAAAMASLAVLYIDRRRYLDAEPLLIIAERVLTGRVPPDHPMSWRRYRPGWRASPWLAARPHRPWIALAAPSRWPGATRMAAPPSRCGRSAPRWPPWNASTRPEPVLKEALAQDTKHYGADGVETARSLAQLANLYLRWGRAADALPLIQQAVAIDQQRLGATHPFIADDLHDLGLVYEALNRRDYARRTFTAAIAVLEARRRAEHAARRLCRARTEPPLSPAGRRRGGRGRIPRRAPHPQQGRGRGAPPRAPRLTSASTAHSEATTRR